MLLPVFYHDSIHPLFIDSLLSGGQQRASYGVVSVLYVYICPFKWSLLSIEHIARTIGYGLRYPEYQKRVIEHSGATYSSRYQCKYRYYTRILVELNRVTTGHICTYTVTQK